MHVSRAAVHSASHCASSQLPTQVTRVLSQLVAHESPPPLPPMFC